MYSWAWRARERWARWECDGGVGGTGQIVDGTVEAGKTVVVERIEEAVAFWRSMRLRLEMLGRAFRGEW